MKREEFYDKDYNLEDIEVDDRFKICNKEMKLAYGLQIIYMITLITVAYTLGRGDLREYSFIMGMPTWWFAVMVTAISFAAIAIYISLTKFTDMSLTDESYEEEETNRI